MPAELPRYQLRDMNPELAAVLRPRVARLGYLGEFFQYTAAQPEALAAFVAFTESAKLGLANDLVEVVALTAAGRLDNEYERNQHEQLCLKLGFDKQWIHAVQELAPAAAPLLDEAQRMVQRFVLQALGDADCDSTSGLTKLSATIGATEAIAVLFLVARYAAHALIVSCLGLDPPVPSIFGVEPAL